MSSDTSSDTIYHYTLEARAAQDPDALAQAQRNGGKATARRWERLRNQDGTFRGVAPREDDWWLRCTVAEFLAYLDELGVG